jgi:NADH dehydrogenase
VIALLDGAGNGRERYELAGPDVLTHEEIVRLALRSFGRRRRIAHVSPTTVRLGLRGLEELLGPAAFATWEEARLLDVPMVAAGGTADAESLGVRPRPMRAVLGAG